MNQNKALEIAYKAHIGQLDKGGSSYILHPVRVALHCQTEDEKIVALLHDVVEDTSITFEDLKTEWNTTAGRKPGLFRSLGGRTCDAHHRY